MKASISSQETQRLQALRQYDILDTLPEQAYDDITLLASVVCDTPIALVSLVDQERQWFKSRNGLDASQTPRDFSFCAHAILQPEKLLVVPDARDDARFSDNPLVLGAPHIQFYAGAPLLSPDGQALGTICVIDQKPRLELTWRQEEALRALSRQVMAQMELRRESLIDGLTAVRNRRAFDAALKSEIERSRRTRQPLSLLLLDIDFFKKFNDEMGHVAGDELLRKLAQGLQKTARTSDCVARYGGEEFVILLPDTDLEGALTMAERFRRTVANVEVGGRSVTISSGVVSADFSQPGQGLDANSLVNAADKALYRAKANGRNQVASDQPLLVLT